MGGFSIAMLGDLQVQTAGRSVPVPGTKQRLLLATLALRSGQIVSVDELVERLWDEEPPRSARTTLRGYVRRLRSVLRGAGRTDSTAIDFDAGGYRLMVESESIDLNRFRRLRQEATTCADPLEEAALLAEALRLWRGRPLSGLGTARWADDIAVGLEEEMLQTVERQCDLSLDRDEAWMVSSEVQRLIAYYPLRETLWHRLILSLHRGGRTAEALSRYQQVRQLLADQLGVAPSANLRALHLRILSENTKLEGEVRSPTAVSAVRTPTLPADRFVGRRGEINALDHLCRDTARVVVLDGGAGVGKTALVRHWLEHTSLPFPNGRLYLDLRGSRPGQALPPGEVAAELLRAFGTGDGDIPEGDLSRIALCRSVLTSRRMLVVLDDARDHHQVEKLLPGVGGVVLITSQNQLRGLVARNGAARLSVGRLRPDEGRELVGALLKQSRRAVEADAVDQLLDLCAGLPLALRIAIERFCRITEVSLGQLVAELQDERNLLDLLQTDDDAEANIRVVLSRAFNWLEPAETILLRRLSSRLWPSFDLDAAAGLMGVDRAQVRVLLERLISMSLVEQRGFGSYRIHRLQQAVVRDWAPADATAAPRHQDSAAPRPPALGGDHGSQRGSSYESASPRQDHARCTGRCQPGGNRKSVHTNWRGEAGCP
ncbi:winged helix-turn-helix domain-containing protein [Micromonospora carbonacea subsp. aurantiaca]|uniref:Winged helix-turn-helix domain-containing protein n=2 Tax=Micromonospora carbonacea TaxID=47853 RepID=A0A7H8XTA6_9ACTN|nr:winged helix-turn-helix domain-containing protein [Micromonospora carbonacea]